MKPLLQPSLSTVAERWRQEELRLRWEELPRTDAQRVAASQRGTRVIARLGFSKLYIEGRAIAALPHADVIVFESAGVISAMHALSVRFWPESELELAGVPD